MMIIPRYPSEPNKKPPLEKLERVNNNYNQVVGEHTLKINNKSFLANDLLIKITSRGAATHPQLINGKNIT